jgi:hypothetical protein
VRTAVPHGRVRATMNPVQTVIFGVALLATGVAACSRGDGSPPSVPLLTASEADRANETKIAPYVKQIDGWVAEVQRMIAQATAAQGDVAQLVAVRRSYVALQQAARRDMAGADKALTPEQKHALQAHYGERLAPLVGQLQPLLFAALLADLPQGATPALAAVATPTTQE